MKKKPTVTVFGVLHETLISRTIGDCSFLVDCRSIFFVYRRSRCRCLLCVDLCLETTTKKKVIESRVQERRINLTVGNLFDFPFADAYHTPIIFSDALPYIVIAMH